MKKIFIFSFLFLMSCVSTQKTATREPQNVPEIKSEYVTIYKNELAPAIAESIAWRKESEAFLTLILQKQKEDIPMTSEETGRFFTEARKYVSPTGIRKILFDIKDKFVFLVQPKAITKVSTGDKSALIPDKKSGKQTWILNPTDQTGKDYLFGLRISLTAALVLYDNFLSGIKPHYDQMASRTKLKFDAQKEYKGVLEKIVTSFFDKDQRKMLARGMNLFAADYNLKVQNKIEVTPEEMELNKYILNSAFYNFMLKEGQISDPWGERWEQKFRNITDLANYTKRASTFAVSFTFGNLVGQIKSEDRDGILKALPPSEVNYLRSKMEPFDVLLEKTPFRATDKFIPGYYGHVAVYLGTKEQLEDANIWHLFPKNLQEQIEKGENIVEALRFDERKKGFAKFKEGVQLNSLEHFLDIDELLVIRQRNELTQKQLDLYAKNTIDQLWPVPKPYDFNFDVNSKERIVCSELAYVIFTDITWITAKTMGRHTISPDHVMAMAFPGKPFQPVYFYDKNQRRIEDDPKKPDFLANELLRNIQASYSMITYKEDSIFRQTTEPQEIMHLKSGVASLQKRLEMIRAAKNTIELEYFIYHEDKDPAARMLTQELIEKAKQPSEIDPKENIKIRVLVDASATVLKLKDEYATILKENDIEVRYYNAAEMSISNFMLANQRNHRKTIIVDGKEAITGGRNIGAEYFDLSRKYNFLDTDIYIKGSMAKVFQESFDAYWYSPMSAEPKLIRPNRKLGENDPKYQEKIRRARSLIAETQLDRDFEKSVESWGKQMLAKEFKGVCNKSTFVSDLPGDAKNSRRTFNTIVSEVSKSKESLYIESPYFVLTDRGDKLLSSLLKKPGYKLSVQTNSLQSTDATYTVAAFYPMVEALTSKGMDIFIYKGSPPNYMSYPPYEKESVWGIHSKRAVIDGHTTLIGTYNVDPRSSDLNNEMVFICHDNPELAQDVLKEMKHRRDQSVQLDKTGKPSDLSSVYQGASKNKKFQYLLFKGIIEIPMFGDMVKDLL